MSLTFASSSRSNVDFDRIIDLSWPTIGLRSDCLMKGVLIVFLVSLFLIGMGEFAGMFTTFALTEFGCC